MKLADLIKASKTFETHKKTKRANLFYYDALCLVKKDPVAAIVRFFKTWHPGAHKILVEDENFVKLQDALVEINLSLYNLSNLELQSIEFGKYYPEIRKIYQALFKVPGPGPTGTAKIMHLLRPKLFVMLDGKIREAYGYISVGAIDYLRFNEKMQKEVEGIIWKNPDKTLAKVVDEYNYLTCSLGVKI